LMKLMAIISLIFGSKFAQVHPPTAWSKITILYK
jgi:hypothetical protein